MLAKNKVLETVSVVMIGLAIQPSKPKKVEKSANQNEVVLFLYFLTLFANSA